MSLKMQETKTYSSECLCEIKKICQVFRADPCSETNLLIQNRNCNIVEDITKPQCNCCKCIKCPVSVIKRLCQIALKNEERQSVSVERYSLFEGGRSLDFDKKSQVDERGDFIYKRKSKTIDSSSDELKSHRDKSSSKEKRSRKFSTGGVAYDTPDRKNRRRTRNENSAAPFKGDKDNALISEKDENMGSKGKIRRKLTKEDLYSSQTLSEDVPSSRDQISRQNKQNRLTGEEIATNAELKPIYKSKKYDKQSDVDYRKAKAEVGRQQKFKDDTKSGLRAKVVKDVRVSRDIEHKASSTISKTENGKSRIQAGQAMLSSKKKNKVNKLNGFNATEKNARNEIIGEIGMSFGVDIKAKDRGNFKPDKQSNSDVAKRSKKPTNKSNVSQEISESARKKKDVGGEIVQDVLIHHDQERRKSGTGKQSKLPNSLVSSPTEKFQNPSKVTDWTRKELQAKRKQGIEEKMKILGTLTPNLVKPYERDIKNENKSKTGHSVDGKKAEILRKTRTFSTPGYKTSMEGLGRGCRKLNYNLGLTRFDQIGVSDLMRIRLEADDQRRIHSVCNKPEIDVAQKRTSENTSNSNAVKPTVDKLEINDACLPPPINPLGYCYI